MGVILAGRRGEIAAAAPALLLGLLLLASVWWDGAFDLRYWAPLTILALALLLAQATANGLALPRRGPLLVALAAIWCLAALTLVSAAWSESPAAAWEGGARMLLYAALFTLAVAVAGTVRGEWWRWLATGLVTAVVAIAAVALLRILFEGVDVFLAGRLNAPVGYRNGTAALFAFAVWPMLGLAARRGTTSGLRAAAFAAAVLLLGLAFLTQSRGVLLGLAAGGAVSLLIGPDRVRRCWLALAAAAVVALASGALLEPFDAFDGGTGTVGDAEVRDAAVALLLATAGAFLAALLLAVLDNGLRADLRARLRAERLAAAALAVLALAACAVAVGRVGDPVSYADGKLDEFTNLESGTTAGGVRLGTVSGQRYDLYRIAWEEFLARPLAGAGEGSYGFAYYRERRTDRNLSNPHSLPLRLLSGTGLLGLGLFLAWLGGLGLAIARRVRTGDERERVWAAGLAAAGATVLAQASLDWLWLLPGLFGLAVLALGLAAAGGEEQRGEEVADAGRGWSVTGRAAVALGLAAALASVAPLFLSDLYVRKARVEARSSPPGALDAARTAERLNPVSTTPLYLQAAALESQGRLEEARVALRKALDREPRNFVTLGLLGDLEVRAGHDRRARDYYRASLRLNPRDVGLQELAQHGGRGG